MLGRRATTSFRSGCAALAMLMGPACAPPVPPQAPAVTAVRVGQTQVRATVAPTLAPRAVAPPAEDLPLATALDESFAAPSLDWPTDTAATPRPPDCAFHLNAPHPR